MWVKLPFVLITGVYAKYRPCKIEGDYIVPVDEGHTWKLPKDKYRVETDPEVVKKYNEMMEVGIKHDWVYKRDKGRVAGCSSGLRWSSAVSAYGEEVIRKLRDKIVRKYYPHKKFEVVAIAKDGGSLIMQLGKDYYYQDNKFGSNTLGHIFRGFKRNKGERVKWKLERRLREDIRRWREARQKQKNT